MPVALAAGLVYVIGMGLAAMAVGTSHGQLVRLQMAFGAMAGVSLVTAIMAFIGLRTTDRIWRLLAFMMLVIGAASVVYAVSMLMLANQFQTTIRG